MRRILLVSTVVLALLGVAASLEHLIVGDHYNPGFVEHPWLMRAHVTLGAVYLLLALPQFLPGLRARRPRLHRAFGRLAVAAGLVAGLTAVVIGIAFPFSGLSETAVTLPFALLFLVSLGRGIWLARARRFALHREWMIRALAVGTSIATMRLVFVPALLLLGEPTHERARELSTPSFAIAFVLHVAVAEYWIRRTRRGTSGSALLEHEGELVPAEPEAVTVL
ncbi:MAG: DUF2306 domain-containing protein [Myxococcota bacterium]